MYANFPKWILEIYIWANLLFLLQESFITFFSFYVFWLFWARKPDSKCLVLRLKLCCGTRQVFSKTFSINIYWLNGLNNASIHFWINLFGLNLSQWNLSLRIRWPKYWSFSFSISPSSEYSGVISFRIDWFDLLAVQGTLKSLLQHSSKASILWRSAFFIKHP